MNEWSTKRFYSGSTATDPRPPVQVYTRQYWEQDTYNGNWMNSLNMNNYVTNCAKECEVEPDFGEEIGIPPVTAKKKKNGASDPRFKRVISTERRGDGDTEAEKLGPIPKLSLPLDNEEKNEEALNDKVISFLKTPINPCMFTSPSLKTIDDRKEKDMTDEVTKDPGFQTTADSYSGFNLKTYRCGNYEKASENFNEAKKVESNKAKMKRSVSDCALQTKNIYPAENEEENCEKVRAYPSATRLSKVNNWIKEYNVSPEKRRSVITVIGQTQTKPFSKILNEINQRRKLAKELDKHALCEAIMGSVESRTDVKNLVAKVDFLLPDGKIIYSTEKVYLCKDNKYTDASPYSQKSLEIWDAVDQKKNRCEMIPERDSSICQLGKRTKQKRSSKRLLGLAKPKQEVKDGLKSIYENSSSIMVWSFLATIFLCLFSLFFYAIKPSHPSILSQFFKPKTTSWYDRLLL